MILMIYVCSKIGVSLQLSVTMVTAGSLCAYRIGGPVCSHRGTNYMCLNKELHPVPSVHTGMDLR